MRTDPFKSTKCVGEIVISFLIDMENYNNQQRPWDNFYNLSNYPCNERKYHDCCEFLFEDIMNPEYLIPIMNILRYSLPQGESHKRVSGIQKFDSMFDSFGREKLKYIYEDPKYADSLYEDSPLIADCRNGFVFEYRGTLICKDFIPSLTDSGLCYSSNYNTENHYQHTEYMDLFHETYHEYYKENYTFQTPKKMKSDGKEKYYNILVRYDVTHIRKYTQVSNVTNNLMLFFMSNYRSFSLSNSK